MASKDGDPVSSSAAKPGSDAATGEGKNTKVKDGRAHNQPPEATKIRIGEVRNPHGRGGKPKPPTLSEFDEIYRAEAARIVSRDADRPVSALQRLIQQDWHSALVMGNEKAAVRVIGKMETIEGKAAVRRQEAISWFWEMKLQFTEQFATARRLKRPPPDVAHPDHVQILHDEVVINGPIDPEGRKIWEDLKQIIKVAACFHTNAKNAHRREPTPERHEYLKAIEAHRRRVMRMVPKGWNWREDIYCRHSQTEATNAIIRDLQKAFDEET